MKILFLQDKDWINQNPHQQIHLQSVRYNGDTRLRVIDYEILWHEEDGDTIEKNRDNF